MFGFIPMRDTTGSRTLTFSLTSTLLTLLLSTRESFEVPVPLVFSSGSASQLSTTASMMSPEPEAM